MATDLTPLCPGGCTEGAMCPACFRAWQSEGDALRLRQWLLSERLSRPRPANDGAEWFGSFRSNRIPSMDERLAIRELLRPLGLVQHDDARLPTLTIR